MIIMIGIPGDIKLKELFASYRVGYLEFVKLLALEFGLVRIKMSSKVFGLAMSALSHYPIPHPNQKLYPTTQNQRKGHIPTMISGPTFVFRQAVGLSHELKERQGIIRLF